MGVKIKTMTVDCESCSKFLVNDENKFTCSWGHKKKTMKPPKGKKSINCKLRKE